MFSWVCPRCGRDNAPSITECPNCKELDLQAAAQAAAQPPAQPPPVQSATSMLQQQPVQAPPQYAPQYAPQQTPYAPPPAYPLHPMPPHQAPVQQVPQHRVVPQPRGAGGMPTWLLMILFAFAFLGLGAAIYYGYQRFNRVGPAGFTGGEQAVVAPKPKGANPLQRYVEVVGIRLTQDAKKRPQAKFIVVNHSNTELNDMSLSVTLWASTSRSEEDAVGAFSFKLPSIGPFESKEMTEPLKTKLKIYELPDWQNATAQVQITSQ